MRTGELRERYLYNQRGMLTNLPREGFSLFAVFVFRIVIICLHKQKAGRRASIALNPQSETTVPFVVLNFKTAAELSGLGVGGKVEICYVARRQKKKSKFWKSRTLSSHSRLQRPDCLSNGQGL